MIIIPHTYKPHLVSLLFIYFRYMLQICWKREVSKMKKWHKFQDLVVSFHIFSPFITCSRSLVCVCLYVSHRRHSSSLIFILYCHANLSYSSFRIDFIKYTFKYIYIELLLLSVCVCVFSSFCLPYLTSINCFFCFIMEQEKTKKYALFYNHSHDSCVCVWVCLILFWDIN